MENNITILFSDLLSLIVPLQIWPECEILQIYNYLKWSEIASRSTRTKDRL